MKISGFERLKQPGTVPKTHLQRCKIGAAASPARTGALREELQAFKRHDRVTIRRYQEATAKWDGYVADLANRRFRKLPPTSISHSLCTPFEAGEALF